jgi:D-inositol-3-phosphate glycosyltransferase
MIERVGYLAMHTSPLLQPGSGDAGGMNVYLDELSRTMAERGIEVTVFTRRTDPVVPPIVEVRDGYRVVHLEAGPVHPLPVADLPRHVPAFAEAVASWSRTSGANFDLVHSHYWLSGWAGVLVKETLQIPLANSFHTLGRVKDLARRADEHPSSRMRVLTEDEVIAHSDCVIASTPYEFDDLLLHYDARPERLCVSPAGIDHDVFTPGDRTEARRKLGLGEGPTVLFAGRIQGHKGVDVAVEAIAQLPPEVALMIVGGPSGTKGDEELTRLEKRTADLGLTERIAFVPPQPHDQLVDFYRAADVLVMPSRSESFGLVAAEAQACGLPVVAARVGGLAYVVDEGASGILVDGHDPQDYATAIRAVLSDPGFQGRLSEGAVAFAERFSWPATADRLLELYAGITGRGA